MNGRQEVAVLGAQGYLGCFVEDVDLLLISCSKIWAVASGKGQERISSGIRSTLNP